jgi:HAD superfamily hydrolase (TIGR01458 family)
MTAILLDIDGVLHVSGEAVPGGPDAVRALRDGGHRLRFVTNNTTRARSILAGELQSIGFDLESEDITTTPLAAGSLLQGKRVLALVMSSIRNDLAEHVQLVENGADAVLLGGADESEETAEVFSYGRLNQAYAELREGARLVCLHKNKWWQTSRGPLLDSGAFVAGLEYAAETEATVLGKPSAAYFKAALDALDSDPELTWMVGDDIETDIAGAAAAGLRTVLVRTGKFRPDTVEFARVQPDGIITSIAALPGWIETAS